MTKRKEPKECPICQGKEFSYESGVLTLETGEANQLVICDESEWVCLECDEIFYYRAWYELGKFLSESMHI